MPSSGNARRLHAAESPCTPRERLASTTTPAPSETGGGGGGGQVIVIAGLHCGLRWHSADGSPIWSSMLERSEASYTFLRFFQPRLLRRIASLSHIRCLFVRLTRLSAEYTASPLTQTTPPSQASRRRRVVVFGCFRRFPVSQSAANTR